MAEADCKSTELNGKGQVPSSKVAIDRDQLWSSSAFRSLNSEYVCTLPGEEKEPGEDQHGGGDASASQEGQSQTHDGK